MIRLKNSPYPSTAAFLTAATRIAEHYGFEPLEKMPRVKNGERRTLPPGAKPDAEIVFSRREERTLPSAARRLLHSLPTAPRALLAWRIVPLPTPSSPGISLELHAAGIPGAIAEALLIVAANAIVKDAGVEGRVLSINNMGAVESSGRYVRDVALYLRKHIESISPTLRPRATADPLGALVQLIERGHPAVSRAPQAMEYLTEDERRRFWDLLEYLEEAGLPYELNGQILGSRDCWTHALFEIASVDLESGLHTMIAFGGRFDPLMSRFARAPYPAAMIAIHCESRGARRLRQQPRALPLMYFAHLGHEARRRALPALEGLREAGVPVYHGLWHERMGEQMAAARTYATPYILIMGHKEAVEGTILVREVATNSQEAVPLTDLPTYLKRKRVGPWKAEMRV